MPNAQPDRRGRRRSACAGLPLRLLGALLLLFGGGLAVAGCQQQQAGAPGPAAASPFGGGAAGASAATTVGDADEFLVVDCLLPAQVRRLGSRVTYLGQRRALRTAALDCAIRGGEYVAYDRADYRTALAVWLDSAQQGDAQAQNYVGEIYERGLGIAPDYRTAAEWYRRAAEQNFGPAQINLGQLYETGRGVPRDQVAALNWYRRASGLAEAGLTFVAATENGVEAAGLDRRRDGAARSRAEADAAEARAEAERLRAQTEALQRRIAELERVRQAAAPAAEPAAVAAAATRAEDEAALERERRSLAEERRRLAAEREGLEAQRAEVRQGDASALAEVERSLADLRARESALEEQSGALAAREAELARLRAEVEAREARMAEREARLQGSEAAVAERQREAERLDRELAELRRAFEEQRQQLAALEAGGARQGGGADGAAGPRIILIDPELPAVTEGTRGVSTPVIRVRSGTTERPIVGRLEASAGMLSMLVNDSETSWDSNGMFQAAVPVAPGGTRVQMVAIDKLGRRSTLDFTLAPEELQTAALTPDTVEAVARPSLPPIEFGRYHALVIGNNAYTRIPKLETAIADAEAVAGILERKYGFQVTLLRDADRYQILSALNQLRATLTEDDNLLIYYAGHGELDEANMRGHWLPVDAEPDSTANWISNIQLTDILNVMKAKHVLVVADSCYSGALTRSTIAQLDTAMTNQEQVAWMKAMARKRSRTALTSGGLAPTLDGGGGGHSVFARALLEALEANRDVLTGLALFQEVAARVTYVAEQLAFEQTPLYAPVKFAGHEAGEFFLVPRT